MLTETAVRKLAAYRGDPAVSTVYLDVDGRRRPVPADYKVAFEQLVDGLRKRVGASGERRLRRSVDADIDRARTWLRRDLNRTITRGLAFFACSVQGYFEAIELPRPVRDATGLGPAPHISQLLAAVDENEPLLVALVDRRQLRLLRPEPGEPIELSRIEEPDHRAIDTLVELGDFERRTVEATRAHYRRCADGVERAVADHPDHRLILGGPEEAVAGLQAHLASATQRTIVGRAAVGLAAAQKDILDAVAEVVRTAERHHEVELVEKLRQRAAAGSGGVVGLEPTLAALAERRVETLFVSEGFVAPGARCPSCGWLGPDIPQCPKCRATNVEISDIVEFAISEATAQHARVEFCRATELDRFGRIGAIERY